MPADVRQIPSLTALNVYLHPRMPGTAAQALAFELGCVLAWKGRAVCLARIGRAAA